ncbi:hypothetical protein A3A93_05195 [Candidatus Roizmanbacteria bacterium RIFCSPLOWO2_01_FULL_38_12]|uniref:Peptidase M11 gametolysin domain-containing protein n=1 Tax=Candidatus Roizmanbacteria bacterium RIFCSPLOWO2_01_FULL_38_12 TaxID=1802061 RepID=A0A1F7IR00_9BACT|nr:MAG: hypothetical protein A2861_03300 [Candidatus Roizmanbacteria bacterium RIFCSPHIGHO2_01_FULL_38_15]OGK35979.1 MAG: hypothetical protein A3F59_05340 [Candidatus Roizmanbacteria bacterium RIFCSPHIGHO2_12_FULL_38_13]OGK45784.1 MAG: hypothetical protein A3A93_05195 [Candidatus Roizmanbacteria bacterium RIFCSPLOWO2_01_FULL_38_12]
MVILSFSQKLLFNADNKGLQAEIKQANKQLIKAVRSNNNSDYTVSLAKKRKKLLLKEAKEDPKAFLKHILSQKERRILPKTLNEQGLLERDIEIKGKVSTVHFDNFDKKHHKDEYEIDVQEGKKIKSYLLNFSKKPSNFSDGSIISVKGVAIDTQIVVQSSELNQPAQAVTESLSSYIGDIKVAVIMIDFATNTSPTPTPAPPPAGYDDWSFTVENINSLIFTAPNSASAFFREVSYGQTTLSGDVFGIHTLSADPTSCDWLTYTELANNAVETDGNDLSQYDKRIYLWPHLSTCSDNAWADLNGSSAWLNGTSARFRNIVVHELGHTFGLHHATSINCGIKAIDDYANCNTAEYGNLIDTMGASLDTNGHTNVFHFSSAYKTLLGWIPSSKVQTITSSGEYLLSQVEAEVPAGSIQTLRIKKKDTDEYYYVEYRQRHGFDEGLPESITGGADIIIADEIYTIRTKLVDANPQTQGNFWDASLTDGSEFHDYRNGIIIKQLSHSASSVNLFVTITYPTNEPNISPPIITTKPSATPTPLPPPQSVEDLTISLVDNNLELNWLYSSGATSYNIYRRTVNLFSTSNPYLRGNKIASVTTNKYLDSTLGIIGNPDNNYFYIVTATNANGESDNSDIVGEFDYRFPPYEYVFIAPPFITLPFSNAQSFAQFSDIGSVMVIDYNSNKQGLDWFIWRQNDNFSAGTNFPISPNNGFIVKKEGLEQDASIVTFVGQLPNQTQNYTFNRGMNSFPMSMLYHDYTLSSRPAASSFDPYGSKFYHTYFKINNEYKFLEYIDGSWQGTDFPVLKGYAYMIELSRPLQWTYHGVIIPGPRWDLPQKPPEGERLIYDIFQGEQFVLQTQVSDPDTSPQELQYNINHQPEGGTFDTDTLQYRYTLNSFNVESDYGNDYVEIFVSDGTSRDRLYFELRFNPNNQTTEPFTSDTSAVLTPTNIPTPTTTTVITP